MPALPRPPPGSRAGRICCVRAHGCWTWPVAAAAMPPGWRRAGTRCWRSTAMPTPSPACPPASPGAWPTWSRATGRWPARRRSMPSSLPTTCTDRCGRTWRLRWRRTGAGSTKPSPSATRPWASRRARISCCGRASCSRSRATMGCAWWPTRTAWSMCRKQPSCSAYVRCARRRRRPVRTRRHATGSIPERRAALSAQTAPHALKQLVSTPVRAAVEAACGSGTIPLFASRIP
ncbi:hypothetical protein CBM2626_A60226 [Cupriavidus taiwanensis]|nr:hypothetical protein CBM2626_A60226 [Cupriavidus taiwanensis]